jgi:hypothetical protein
MIPFLFGVERLPKRHYLLANSGQRGFIYLFMFFFYPVSLK